jgi:hypothetical protein
MGVLFDNLFQKIIIFIKSIDLQILSYLKFYLKLDSKIILFCLQRKKFFNEKTN